MEAPRIPSPPPNASAVSFDPQVLFREGKRLRALAARQLREIDQAIQELRRDYETLNKEREAFHRQQEEIRCRWEKRWHQEWRRLQTQEAEIEANRQAVMAESRRINGDLELQRRQIESAWQQLRQAQEQWQAHRAAEAAELAAQRGRLAAQSAYWKQTEEILRERAALHESLIHSCRQEIAHLETRIRNYRAKLESLRDEAALVEAGLCSPQAIAETFVAEESAERRASSDLRIVLDEMSEIAAALLDESQRSLETQQRMAEVKSAWEADWHRAVDGIQQAQAELSLREEQLRNREHAVALREQDAARRLSEARCRERELQTREIAVAYHQAKLARRQARWRDELQARRVLLQKRFVLAHRLREQWQQLITSETQRLLRLRTGCEQARLEYLTAREMLRQKERELATKEQQLLQRELAIAQIEQSLVGATSESAPAASTLTDLAAAWERTVAQRLLATQSREAELARMAQRLERLRSRLLKERESLEELRQEALAAQAEAKAQRQRYQEETERAHQQINRLRTDRDHLLNRIRQQEEHIEHLTMHLLDNSPEPPALAAAA
jgi:hypothetical protein